MQNLEIMFEYNLEIIFFSIISSSISICIMTSTYTFFLMFGLNPLYINVTSLAVVQDAGVQMSVIIDST